MRLPTDLAAAILSVAVLLPLPAWERLARGQARWVTDPGDLGYGRRQSAHHDG